VIVSPDAGGVERARAFAKRLNAGLAIIDKRRDAPNQAKAMAVIGDGLPIRLWLFLMIWSIPPAPLSRLPELS